MCSQCRWVFYCDRKCQKSDWSQHRRDCATRTPREKSPPPSREDLIHIAQRNVRDLCDLVDAPPCRFDAEYAMRVCEFLYELFLSDETPRMAEFMCANRVCFNLAGLLRTHDDSPGVIQAICRLAVGLARRVSGPYLVGSEYLVSSVAEIFTAWLHVPNFKVIRSLSKLLAVFTTIFDESSDLLTSRTLFAGGLKERVADFVSALQMLVSESGASAHLCTVLRHVAAFSIEGAQKVVDCGGIARWGGGPRRV